MDRSNQKMAKSVLKYQREGVVDNKYIYSVLIYDDSLAKIYWAKAWQDITDKPNL